MQDLEQFTLYHVLERSAALFANEPALAAVGSDPLTFSDFKKQVNTLSSYLADLGIEKGDKVAILAENSPNWGVAYFAVTCMGAVVVPILPEFHTDAVQHILRHSEARVVFVSEKLFGKVEYGQYDVPPIFLLIDSFQPVDAGVSRDLLQSIKDAGKREFRKLYERALAKRKSDSESTSSAPAPVAPVSEDDVAAIIYTSGTTGHSKGVVLTHKNIVFDADSVKFIVSVGPGDRMLSILPLSHTYECTLGLVLPILNGVYVQYLDKPPTARVLIPAMQAVKPTCILSVPLVIEKIYKNSVRPKLTSSAFKRFLYNIPVMRRKMHRIAGKKLLETFGGHIHTFCIGGAALAGDLERFLREAQFPYAIGYGLTETSPLVAGSNSQKTRFSTTGYALPQVEIRIDSPNPENGEGEIFVRGANVMREYYKAPQITAEVLDSEGWFHTGDLGFLSDDGYLSIRGRLKNVLIGASGENIYPEELEAILQESEYVVETIVLQQDDKLIARIHLDYARLDEAFGTLNAAERQEKVLALLEDLRTATNKRIPRFAFIHKAVEQTEPFEKTPTHKIKRYLYM